MTRRRSIPWIHRYSRFLMGAIAVVGALITAYLTVVAFAGGKTACPMSGGTDGLSACDIVLQSPYAKIFGLPLSLFGLLAYLAMVVFALAPYVINPEINKKLRNQLEEWTGRFLLIGGTAMAIFSGYLLYISAFVLKDACIYCITSAICSIALFVLAIIGREWEEMGQVVFTSIIVGMVTLVGTFGLYARANAPTTSGQQPIPAIATAPQPPYGWKINTQSGPDEIALAKHISAIGGKMYSAFWCPHCFEQKQLFGEQAFQEIDYVECDAAGKNPQVDACRAAGIQSFPTWKIKDQTLTGTQLLEKLAKATGYTGSTNFKYTMPGR
jgi:uncharacterized membrane protein